MAISYNKLWKLLIDKNMSKMDLRGKTGIGTTTLAKLGKNQAVSGTVIERICQELSCDVGDIMEVIPDDKKDKRDRLRD